MRIGQRPSIATQSVRRNEASRCANSGRKQVQQTVALFDHHVGELLNAQWHLYAKSLGGLQVDYKLEFYRDLDGELACLRASEDTISIDCRLPKIVERIIPVGDQATDFRVDTLRINGSEAVASRQRCDLPAIVDVKAIGHHYQATIWLLSLCGNDGFEFSPVVNGRDNGLHCEGLSSVSERL